MTLSAGLSLSQSYDETDFTIRDIAEDGILIAAAFGLNFIKIPVGPTGGSINLQMLPLMIIALRRGPFHGLVSGGIVYGLLTCLTDGYGFACYPFDYLIGRGFGLLPPIHPWKEANPIQFERRAFPSIGGHPLYHCPLHWIECLLDDHLWLGFARRVSL